MIRCIMKVGDIVVLDSDLTLRFLKSPGDGPDVQLYEGMIAIILSVHKQYDADWISDLTVLCGGIVGNVYKEYVHSTTSVLKGLDEHEWGNTYNHDE